MKKLSLIFAGLCLLCLQVMAQTGITSWISIGADGKLKYTPDAKGNTIPDFSAVGYKNGDVAIPTVPVVRTISAVSGDNTANIQNAINAVAALPLGANGFRGALLLKAGTYNINNNLYIRSSGVVIRGEGNGTVLMATKTSQYSLITVTGSGGFSGVSSTSKKIQGAYIPIGAKTFTLPAGHGFVTGDDVMLQRRPNQAWINMLGMNVLSQIPCDNGGCNVDWTPGEYIVNYLRKVVAVNGNTITLDAPNVDVIDSKYAEGYILKYNWSGKIENCGVENLYMDSRYTNANDENHGWHGVSFTNAKNGWVRNVEVHHFGYAAVTVNESGAWISILNCKNIDPISQTIGGRKYSFNINGQRNLVKNCSTNGGRHDYVTGAKTAGPNAFVNSTAVNQKADIGPHHRWGTGALFDNIKGDFEQNAQNRLGYGTGHGWSGAQTMYWNCTSPTFRIHNPTQHINWAIGCKGNVTSVGNQYSGSPGVTQSTNNFIGGIQYLYDKQLADRLNTSVPPVDPVPNNLAKGKPVTVSSTEVNANVSTAASNATDGSYETRWASSFEDPQWLSVDLGANYAINRVKISWETAMASAYEIQVSSNGTSGWTTIKSVTGNTSTTNDQTGLSGTGRYVRIYGTNRTTNYGYSIFEIEVYGSVVESPYSGTPIHLPGKIEAEDFNLGGENLAYHDMEAANQGGSYRTSEGVDIQTTTDQGGGYNIGYTSAGEWLRYMVDVTSTGNYNLAFRTASTNGTGAARLEVDGVDVTGTVIFPNTGAWQTWATTSLSNITLSAGAHTVRLFIVAGSFNLNYVEVTPATPVCLPVSASADDGNIPVNVLDNNLTTRWSANGDGQWIQFCQGSASTISGVQIAFYSGNTRQSVFDVQLSQDGLDWNNALTNVRSSGTSLALENFTFTSQLAKYIRIVGHGNTVNTWNSYTEVKILTGEPPVNQLPTVTITSPVANSSYNPPASIVITASASDVDGTVNKVDFYNGTTLLGTDLTAPYTFTMTGVAIGSYSITVAATDNMNATTTSAAVTVTVVSTPINQAPTITLTAPANNTSANAPASIAINATATDADGSISKVEFYSGTTLLGTDNTSPYSYTWTNVPAGTYAISAKATDNSGASATSATASIKVNTVIVSNPCSNLAAYKENGGYAAGAKVQNAGKQYQCKPYPYSGWCNGSAWAYAPGVGSYWTDAWTLVGSCTASREANEAAANESFLSNAPNPFNTSTNLTVVVSESGNISLTVYNKSGMLIKTVTEGYFDAGTYEFTIDATDLPADLYLVKYKTEKAVITKKIIRAQ